MDRSQMRKMGLVSVCMTMTLVASLLRAQADGALAVVLYALAVAGILGGIVLLFSWAKEHERAQGTSRPRRRWFTPWRRRGA